MISPWVFEFFHELTDPNPSTDRLAIRAHFEWYLDLWATMEPRGFEGIFFSEHHFVAAYSPSPNLAIAAMAGRTTTLRLTPTYFQEAPSVWTAVRSAESSERAARRGWKAVAGFASTRDVTGFFDRYRAAADFAGHSTEPSQLGIRRLVTFVDDPNDQAAGVQAGKQHLLDKLNQSIGPLPPFAAVLDKPSDPMDGPLSNDEFISGTPDQVAEQLIDQCHTIGAAHAIVMFGVTDHDGTERHHQLFSEHVIPALRKA